MPSGTKDYTLGVEEEYQIIDPKTRGLSTRGERVIGRAQGDLGDGIVPEMWTSQVEALTPPCWTLSEVRAELVRLRRGVMLAAEAEGARIAAASTHPFSPYREQRLTPKERYWQVVDREQQIAHEQVVFGFHVHVGLDDRAAAIEVMNRARVWLAPMLALSANSPFWLGEDTGYASFRTQVWGRLPTTGPPAPFSSLEEHDALVEALVESGGASEASQVYWDIRRPQKVETVEIRVFDVCSDLDETVMLAGLSRALVRVCRESPELEEPHLVSRPELVRVAHWLASRHGLDAQLVDPLAGVAAPARAAVESLLAFVRPALEEHGDWDEVSTLVYETLRRGNGARRQRDAYDRGGRLEGVVDHLIAETALGTV